jgi:V/A-type H+-transporting ATPase subunit I
MFFVNIIGHLKDVDYVMEKYIFENDIELKDAVDKEYTSKNLDELYSERLIPKLTNKFIDKDISSNYKMVISKDFDKRLPDRVNKREDELKELNDLKIFKEKLIGFKNNINHFRDLDLDLSKLDDFDFFYYEFGRMPIRNYKQYKYFLHEDKNIIVIEGETDKKFVWLIYFSDINSKSRVKNIFSNLNFERIEINLGNDNSEFSSNIHSNLLKIDETLEKLNKKIKKLKISIKNVELLEQASMSEKIFDIHSWSDSRKFGAVIAKDFFIFMGWIPEDIFKIIEKDSENDDKVILLIDENSKKNPPVLLKNNFLFKPFESLVKLYGIPDYFEIDPTPFLAITYTILFGMMFGDIGQGLIFVLVGFLLSFTKRFKKNNLLKVLPILGFSAMIFGWLYGSFFGFENLIKPKWIKPSDNIMFILIFTVISGIFLTFLSMVFNLINCLKKKDIFDLLIGQNGFTGLFFYTSILLSVLFLFYKINFNYIIYLLFFAGINLFLIAFKELIKKILKKEKNLFDSQNIFIYFFEKIIELAEILLNYFTNTISFIRVGAFTLSHAGMMSVVLLLSERDSGNKNWFVIVFGNILVMLLEGLTVGIQVLRLEFYEMFGRFFRGTGREFVSEKKDN